MVTVNKPPVLTAPRCPSSGLWRLTLDPDAAATNQPTGMHTGAETANVIFDLPSTRQSFLWYHAAAGFPPKETFLKAVRRGNYATWPKLTTRLIHKYFPDSDETQQGHMKRQCQGVGSTKQQTDEEQLTTPTTKKMHDVYVKIHNASETMHTDQTGRFPATSSKGNQYIMVLVEVDGNYIDAEPMKNRTEKSIIKAYQALWARLTASGTVKPQTHLLDNEASAAFKAEIKFTKLP